MTRDPPNHTIRPILVRKDGAVRPSPKEYVTKVRKPEDFDEFWDGVLAQAARVPLNPETNYSAISAAMTMSRSTRPSTTASTTCVSPGWYCVPRGNEGKLPVILALPGYQGEPAIPKEWARKGYAALSVAPRGKLRSNSQFNPGYPGLLTHNITDRNTYSYRGFYVDAWRGIDYLLTRDEVDADRIGVAGGSQGGGLTVTTSAMRPEVRAAIAGAPYLCGYVDSIELTRTYPYEEINDYLRLHPDSRDEVVETLAYFDGINFADKITCPFIIYVGLQDNVCPPETGHALFDAVGSADKKLYASDGHGHNAGKHTIDAELDAFFERHLKA